MDGRFRFDEQRTGGVSGNGVKIVLIKTKLGLENGFALERRGFVGANAGGEVERSPFLIARCFTYTPNSQITFARIRASPRQFGLINIINGGALIQTFFAGCEHMLPCATNCLAI